MSEMKMVPLGIAAPFTTGATPPTRENSYYGEGYRWANISDLGSKFISETSKSITQAGYESSGFGPMAEPGDLLFSFKLSVGAVSIAAAPMLTNEAIATFKTGHLLIPTYAYYMLPLYLLRAAGHNIYGAPMLNDGIMRRTKVPLPPLETQRAIADYLDRETGEIDAMLGRLEELAETLELRRSRVIEEILGSDSSDCVPTPMFSLATSEDHRRVPLKAEDRGNIAGEYPYYGASGVIDHIDSYIWDNESRLLVSEDGANLIARRHPIAFLASGKYWVNNHAHVLKPYSAVDSRLMVYAIETADINHAITGSAQPKFTADALWRLRVLFPRDKWQSARIADHLDEVTSKIDAMHAKVAELKALLIERRAALITDVVTGRKDITHA